METVIDLKFVKLIYSTNIVHREDLGIYRNLNEIGNDIDEIEKHANQEIEENYGQYNEFFYEIYYKTVGKYDLNPEGFALNLDELKEMIANSYAGKPSTFKAFGRKRKSNKKKYTLTKYFLHY